METNLIGWHLLNCMFFVSFTVFNYSLIKIYLFSWIHSYSSKHVNKMKQLIANTVAKWWHINWYFYRPQRSCGQGNVFTGVCLSTGGRVSASVHAGMPYPPRPGRHSPRTRETPQDQADPPRQTPPQTRQTPPDQADTPPGPGRPPGTRQTPPREADSSIRSTSGRYVSYLNAFLFFLISKELHVALLSISVSWNVVLCTTTGTTIYSSSSKLYISEIYHFPEILFSR